MGKKKTQNLTVDAITVRYILMRGFREEKEKEKEGPLTGLHVRLGYVCNETKWSLYKTTPKVSLQNSYIKPNTWWS